LAFVIDQFIFGLIFMQQGMPMTFESAHQVATLEPGAIGTDDKGARTSARA
jgi:K+-transporting ATPase ATPase A chain